MALKPEDFEPTQTEQVFTYRDRADVPDFEIDPRLSEIARRRFQHFEDLRTYPDRFIGDVALERSITSE